MWFINNQFQLIFYINSKFNKKIIVLKWNIIY